MRNTGIIKVIVLMASLAVLTGCGPASENPNPADPNSGANPDTGANPSTGSKDTSNQKPIAIITPDNEQSITVGEKLFFNGFRSFDPDNNTPLSYSWNFSGAATSLRTFNAMIPGGIFFTEAGTVTASLVVTDSLGLESDVTSVVVNVYAVGVNRPPNGFISHDNGTNATGSTGNLTITTGTSVEFTGSANDPEGDPVSYNWNIPANVTAPTAPDSQPFTASFPVAGTYVISLTVSDDAGNVDPTPAQVTVTVTDTPVNLPPNGSISHDNGTGATGSTGDITVAIGTNVIFQGSASDPENDPIIYTWNIPADVTAPAAPGSQEFTATFDVAGSYVISLIVSDGTGNVDPTPAQVVVTVTDPSTPVNLPPNGFISHDNGTGATGSTGDITVAIGTNVIFQGSASDPENDPVSYAWVFDGATASSTTGSGPISVSYTTPGSFIVQLTVTDSNGNSDPSPAELTVNVRLPEFKYLPVLTDEDGNPNNGSATYNLSVDGNVAVDVETLTGSWTTPMMRYNGLQLPPVIVAKRGTQMTFNVDNNLAEETTIHWHGFKIPAAQDGGPDMPIAAGGSRTYSFTMAQPAGPLWFHPHAHGTTATQVYNGLAGAFIVTDDITENLENNSQIPSGDQDIALLLQDRRFAADNGTGVRPLIYQAGGGMMGMLGMLGDRILVNGVEMPGLDVATRKYRFRIYNGSNARTYDVALDNGANFTVIGTDGGLLNSPVTTSHIMLSAGERAEIVVDFGAYSVGDNIMLVSRAFPGGGMMGGGTLANGDPFNIMQFQVTTQTTDNVVLYTSLPATADINTRLDAANATATRSFEMNVQMTPGVGMQFTINGQLFDINRVDELVASGATEVWTISNASTMAHPFHAHAIQWQVLDRDGTAASGVDLGWKDTVLVQPGEFVRIIGRFDPVINVGKYMYHCHILEHEEAGMMGIFEVQSPAP
ncbi:PKD domain-containing protein [Kaarinaea lacus]